MLEEVFGCWSESIRNVNILTEAQQAVSMHLRSGQHGSLQLRYASTFHHIYLFSNLMVLSILVVSSFICADGCPAPQILEILTESEANSTGSAKAVSSSGRRGRWLFMYGPYVF